MRSIPAGKFKDDCLELLDEVARTRTPILITKRGKPVARLSPCLPASRGRSLTGSVIKEVGDPYATGERWDADRP